MLGVNPLSFSVFSLLIFCSLWLFGTSSSVAETVLGDKGVVASRSAIASKIGADVMTRGGNAIDAAVATGFALAVTYPSAGNLGGGGFMVIRLSDGSLITNDHREKAPNLATTDMYLDADGEIIKGLSTRSHLAVGVPGSVAGLIDVLEMHGTMSIAEVIQPAIRLARDGFILNRDLSDQFSSRAKDFSRYPASEKVFTDDGRPYKRGDLFVQGDLAKTLSRIKKSGKQGFYSGKTASLLIKEMKAGGGLITESDLAEYRSVWRKPITGSYRGFEIVSMPPPSSGGILLVQMLNMLETLDIAGMGFGGSGTIHAMIEAQRRAYADRSEYLGDSDF